MKKVLVIIMVLSLILAGCNNNNNEDNSNYPNSQEDQSTQYGGSEPPVTTTTTTTTTTKTTTPATSKDEVETNSTVTESTTGETYTNQEEDDSRSQNTGGESYSEIIENKFIETSEENTSTFGIDVDTASYSNMRDMIMSGIVPPVDSIRIEEMINYFNYDYAQPKYNERFSLTTATTDTPWNENSYITMIGLQGVTLNREQLPDSNVVLLLDVSGSMNDPDKLPLLKEAFGELVNNLTDNDRVSIVVYAGYSGVVIEGVNGGKKEELMDAINNLSAGGSTAGSEGILKAYELAEEYFIPDGNNRVILATDGDFNVGLSSLTELEDFISEKRNDDIFLSVIGFGRGNIRDDVMETLADKGNGNYAYIDNLIEAKKVFGEEFLGTMFTIAKDVKIQVSFNSDIVEKYRLIGYENRVMANEDFDNDFKDSGDLGAGHEVTALYEIVLKENRIPDLANLYDIKLRYKETDSDESILVDSASSRAQYKPLSEIDDNLKLALAVTEFGLILRDSDLAEETNIDRVKAYAEVVADDMYEEEFVRLVQRYMDMNK